MESIKILYRILSQKEKIKSFLLLIFVLIGVVFEMLSIGLLIPILASLASDDPSSFLNIQKFFDLIPFVDFASKKETIMFSISVLALIYFAKTIFLTFLSFFQSRFINNLVAGTSINLFERYLYQDYIFHIQRNSSKLIQNIVNEVELMVNVFLFSLITFVSEILIVTGISIILILIEPFGFIATLIIFGTIALIFMQFTKEQVKKWGELRRIHQTSSIQHLQQGINGIKEIKLIGNENQFLDYFKFHINKSAQIGTRLLVLRDLPKIYLELIAVLALLILIFILLKLNYSLDNVVIIIGLFAAAAFKILPCVNRILGSFVNMRYGLASLNIIYKDLNIPIFKTSNKFFREKKLSFKSNIILKNLEYSYPNIKKKVLENINLKIKSNSTIGFIGESGSGKTTLIDLIIGILNPSKGDIFVDDSNIKTNKRLWQNNIGYIPQFIYLIDDTIKKNIALGVSEDKIDEKKIIESIKISQMEHFVKELPNKINTKIGELGVRLSGGQRQRIGIARALYFDPNLLVLDEATSSLDEATEKEIIDSISHMRGKKTIIISSHKKSILNECDEIFEIRDQTIIKRK